MGEELRAQLAAVLERKTMHLHQRHSGFVSNRAQLRRTLAMLCALVTLLMTHTAYAQRAQLLTESELPLLFEAASVLIVAATGAWLWFAEDVACMLALLIAVHQVGGWGYALGVLHGGEVEAEIGAPHQPHPQYLLPSQWPVGASIFAAVYLGDGILRGSIRHTERALEALRSEHRSHAD